MKLTNYSKPILTQDNNSGYKDDFIFKINVSENKLVNDHVHFVINIDLSSDLLRKLLNTSAIPYIKWKSNCNAGCQIISNINEPIILEISQDKLVRTDTIFVCAYLIAIQNIHLENNGEWTDIYEDSDCFDFHPNELLAESNSVRVDYKSTGEPFIHILTDNNGNNKGLTFNSTFDNHIAIYVGPDLKDAYAKINVRSKKVYAGKIVDSFLALNAIVYSIIFLVQQQDLEVHKEKEWFKCLEHCFDEENYDSFEDYIYAMKDELDIDSIYKVTQSILHNAIEFNLIESLRTLQ